MDLVWIPIQTKHCKTKNKIKKQPFNILIGYNWHTINCICLKCTIAIYWHKYIIMKLSQVCLLSWLLSATEVSSCPLLMLPSCPFLILIASNPGSAFCHYQLINIFYMFVKMKSYICMSGFFQSNYFAILLCVCMD